MASTRRQVRFTGSICDLSGAEIDTCEGWVTKVSLQGLPPRYIQYHIDTLSKPLPDGDYIIVAPGTRERVRYQGGQWLSAMPG